MVEIGKAPFCLERHQLKIFAGKKNQTFPTTSTIASNHRWICKKAGPDQASFTNLGGAQCNVASAHTSATGAVFGFGHRRTNQFHLKKWPFSGAQPGTPGTLSAMALSVQWPPQNMPPRRLKAPPGGGGVTFLRMKPAADLAVEGRGSRTLWEPPPKSPEFVFLQKKLPMCQKKSQSLT